MGSRSETKAKAAIERLTAAGIGSGEVLHLSLDLGDPKLAKAAAEDFATKETRLDVLSMSHASFRRVKLIHDTNQSIMQRSTCTYVFY